MRDRCLELAERTGRDPEDVIEQWSERAAIREVDGGQPRAEAEVDAFDDVCSMIESSVLVGLEHDRRGPQRAGHPTTAASRTSSTEPHRHSAMLPAGHGARPSTKR